MVGKGIGGHWVCMLEEGWWLLGSTDATSRASCNLRRLSARCMHLFMV
jgi:hypothetical protein